MPKKKSTSKKKTEKKTETSSVDKAMEQIVGMVSDMKNEVSALSKRVKTIETGGAEDFKEGAKAEDIERRRADRDNIDPRIVKIVDEMLGEDFGIEVKPDGDRPGFLFTLVVPQRLSSLEVKQRPKRVSDESGPKGYAKGPDGEVIMEEYFPEDRRSRTISSLQSYDAIRKHCELVRSNIVAYHQKVNKPLPEFKVKSNVI